MLAKDIRRPLYHPLVSERQIRMPSLVPDIFYSDDMYPGVFINHQNMELMT